MVPIPTSEKRPFIPAQGVAQVEMVYSYFGQQVENVYHVLQGDGATAPTLAEMTDLANAFDGWERNQAAQFRSSAVQCNEIVVRDLSSQSGQAILHVPNPLINGGAPADGLPGNVTVSVKWSTALRGRSFRGRTYHIGLYKEIVAGDQLVAPGIANTLAIYTGLLATINAVPGCAMVVLSYAHNKFWRDAALATPITQATMDINLDSQRRRLTGRGK